MHFLTLPGPVGGNLSPAHGWGLLLGLIGAAAMALSLILYSLRKRLPLSERLGPKRYWLTLHVSLGTLGAVAAAFHAGAGWFGISGLANLAQWGVAVTGGLALYANRWVGEARFRGECSLEALPQTCGEFDSQLGPLGTRWVRAAVRGRFLAGAQRGLSALVAQFFLDVGAFFLLARLAHGYRRQEARDLLFARDEGCASPESLRKRIIAERNLMLFDILEAAGPFWTQIHIALSVALGLLLALHVAVIYLFRPRLLLF